MNEVVDGVLQVRLGYVNAYLVVTDDGLVLVDTGLPRTHAKLLGALAEAQRKVGDISTVLLTHWHTDHVGGLAMVRTASGARVVASAIDTPVVDGSRPAPFTLLMQVARPLLGDAQPAPVDEPLTQDGPFSVPGFTAVHTPGHTDGHVSYLLDRAGGVLFAGDAVAGIRGAIKLSPRPVTADRDAAVRSLAKLATFSFDTAVFGHGTPVTGGAVERFRAAAGS